MNYEQDSLPLFNLEQDSNEKGKIHLVKPESSMLRNNAPVSRGKQISMNEKPKRRDFKKIMLSDPLCLRLLIKNPDFTTKHVLNYIKTHHAEMYKHLLNARSPSNAWLDDLNYKCLGIYNMLYENKELTLKEAVALKKSKSIPEIQNASIYKLLEYAVSLKSCTKGRYESIREFYLRNYYYIYRLRKQDTKKVKF